ncbi:MAG: amidohydrolase [Gammaproteobacteria bacterium]|uniref:Amidohydrolase n=1 Tax=OM182 bacterium MED-G24 TaxID=1986255 RepID=A0A2A5WVE1_9GAMM|nr:amidohydrolase [Gammaproteobacteria bacterium]PDH40248.1 MAG: amidohydrolase [OM182 bacterium MED-G24]RPG23334.1 MAG: amidohydrolase [Gammaproteobacteria bacterium TMED50]
MSHEIVIRGGHIVDGLGGEPAPGDIAIDDGMITAVGKVDSKGRQEIDAEGMTVSPGFIDLHTHLDAQLCWEPDVSPVSQHGVTTALIGNCGVTFAPCKPEDRELLAGMMETVEDIPRESIMQGLPWDWVTYGEYLESLDRMVPGINVAGMIGHGALRYFVMGERGVEEDATDAEKQEMARLVGEAIDQGAIGFSSNRYKQHRIPDGRAVPGTLADLDELVLIGNEVAKRNALYQSVGMQFDHIHHVQGETGARMLFNSTLQGFDENAGKNRLGAIAKIGKGRDLSGVAQVRGSGALIGLQGLVPGHFGEAWRKLRELDVPAKLAAIRDASFREQLISEARAFEGEWPKTSWMYFLGKGASPDHRQGDHNRLSDMANAAGEHWSETLLRLSDETDGKALFNLVGENQNMNALRDLFEGGVFPGVGDAGAHVGMVMDAGWATFVLSHWVREDGLFSMGEAVRLMTSASARILGISDRGSLTPGLRADINIFDADTVAETMPFRVSDFPAGAERMTQGSIGYRATLVNGQPHVLDGELTGIRAGTVVRPSTN